MNNVEFNHYRNIPLCDAHVHFSVAVPLQSTVVTFRERMEYFSWERISLMPIVVCSNRVDPCTNIKALYLKDVLNREKPNSVFAYGNVRQTLDERDTADGFLQQAKTLYDMGVDGFKFLDGKPNMRKRTKRPLDDAIFDKMYAFMEENAIPVVMHLADPPYFWGDREQAGELAVANGWWYGDGTFPSFEQLHSELNALLAKFPKLRLCVAHCGGYLSHDPDTLTAFMERWENVSIDLTPGANIFTDFSLNRDAWRTFFKTYSHRIFFGTDTENNPREGIDLSKYEIPLCSHNFVRKALESPAEETFEHRAYGTVIPLDLDDDILTDVYSENHKRLLPHTRPLNRELIAEQAEIILRDLKSGKEKLWTEEEQKLETENAAVVLEHFSRLP